MKLICIKNCGSLRSRDTSCKAFNSFAQKLFSPQPSVWCMQVFCCSGHLSYVLFFLCAHSGTNQYTWVWRSHLTFGTHSLLSALMWRLGSFAFYVTATATRTVLTHSMCFSLFFCSGTTVSTQKGKSAFNQSPVDCCALSEGWCALVSLWMSVCYLRSFGNEL